MFDDLHEFSGRLAIIRQFCMLWTSYEACRADHGAEDAAHDLQLWPGACVPQVKVLLSYISC